jgi:O-ureido-D-serine cyclo-ligase
VRRDASIALVTAAAARDLDEDMPPLLAALRERGLAATAAVWDDPAVDWSAFGLVLLRSTWDYFARRDAFLAWAERVAAVTKLHNPVPLLAWNTDKRYLHDLERGGVAVVPTTFLAPGAGEELPPHVDFMVKPAVSAGSNDTARYGEGDAVTARTHVRRLHEAGRVAMVQPYQRAVDERGETALVYVDGTLSHAIEKGPIFAAGPQMVGGLFAREQIRPRAPSAAERELGAAVLRVVAARFPAESPLLYARVDLVPREGDGAPAVLELELCEPSVFLAHAEGSAALFAAAIAARLAGAGG